MSSETSGVVIGNHTKKYVARNPAVRWLTQRFVTRLDALLEKIEHDPLRPETSLEVGAGEGVISQRLYQRFGNAVGLDLPDAGLRAEWRERPGPCYLHADAQRLPFLKNRFDLVVCVEVLEHLRDPEAGLAELARVSKRHLLLSVPREPIFRSANLIAGRYIGSLGNTPGHLNHWSAPAFRRFVSRIGMVQDVVTPFPWTICWAVVS